MISIQKKNIQVKKIIFFQSFLGNINIFFIDKIFTFPPKIQVSIQNQILFLKTINHLLSVRCLNNSYFFIKNNKLFVHLYQAKKKKRIINLYSKILELQIKGLLQGFKMILLLNGIGFRSLIQENHLILKLGFSHDIIIPIPSPIQIISKTNMLILSSFDFLLLTQFVYHIRNYKKPEPYKGRGLILKNEKIFKKEGKKKKNK